MSGEAEGGKRAAASGMLDREVVIVGTMSVTHLRRADLTGRFFARECEDEHELRAFLAELATSSGELANLARMIGEKLEKHFAAKNTKEN